MYKQVYLKKGKEDSILRFHPWIFSGAIKAIEEGKFRYSFWFPKK